MKKTRKKSKKISVKREGNRKRVLKEKKEREKEKERKKESNFDDEFQILDILLLSGHELLKEMGLLSEIRIRDSSSSGCVNFIQIGNAIELCQIEHLLDSWD